MPEVWEKWCRLCAEKSDGPKIEGDIEEIIRKFFLGDIYWVNNPPKRICKVCNAFLHKLMHFQERSSRVQAFLSGLDFAAKNLPESKLNIRELRLRFGINPIEHFPPDETETTFTAPVIVPRPFTSKKTSAFSPSKKTATATSKNTFPEFMRVEEIDGDATASQMETIPVTSLVEDSSAMPCPCCSRRFVSESQLKHHMNLMHPVSKSISFDCDMCSKSFSTKDYLVAHIFEKHTPGEIICEHCGMCFSRKPEYNKHYRTHLDHTPFKCSLCARTFKERNKFNRHLEVHSGRTYDCKECGLKLKTPQTYSQHLKIHSDERPFECKVCGKDFKLAKNLRRHMQSHDQTRFHCEECGAGFSSEKKLIKHLRQFHNTPETSGSQEETIRVTVIQPEPALDSESHASNEHTFNVQQDALHDSTEPIQFIVQNLTGEAETEYTFLPPFIQ